MSKSIKQNRCRSFSIVTYLSMSQVASVLLAHDKQIKAYAYIEHNCDLNEDGTPKDRHIHLLLKLVHQTTSDGVRSWFRGFTDAESQPINTLAQCMHDSVGCYDYLTHNTDQSREEGKYLYSESDIVSLNSEYFVSCSENDDNIICAFNDLMSGIPLIEIAQKYGRDFIIHYRSIRMLYNDVQSTFGGELLGNGE